MPKIRFPFQFSGDATLVGIVAFVLMILLHNLIVAFAVGAWTPGPRQTFAGLVAEQGLSLAVICLMALAVGAIFLTPIFLVMSAFRFWRMSQSLCAAAIGGMFMLVMALVKDPESVKSILWPGSIGYFMAATVAVLAFRWASLRDSKPLARDADVRA